MLRAAPSCTLAILVSYKHYILLTTKPDKTALIELRLLYKSTHQYTTSAREENKQSCPSCLNCTERR
jgi:hypothetical protein